MGVKRTEVYNAVDTERDYQDAQREDGRFTGFVLPVAGELLIMQEYIGKAISAYVSEPGEVPTPSLEAIRKVIAVGVRTLEHYGAPRREMP